MCEITGPNFIGQTVHCKQALRISHPAVRNRLGFLISLTQDQSSRKSLSGCGNEVVLYQPIATVEQTTHFHFANGAVDARGLCARGPA